MQTIDNDPLMHWPEHELLADEPLFDVADSPAPYRYEAHVALSGSEGWRGVARRRRRRSGERANAAVGVAAIVDSEALIRLRSTMARSGAAAGVDRVRLSDLSFSEYCEIARALSDQILAGQYRPQPLRRVDIPKANGGVRTLEIPTIFDRLISRAVAEAITPIIDADFLPTSYGFRPRRGVWDVWLDLECELTANPDLVVVTDDIENCFPSIRIADVVAVLNSEPYASRIAPDIRELAERCIRGYEQQNRTVGLAQGNPLAPLMANLLLHHRLDVPLRSAAQLTNPTVRRYADNLVITAEEGDGATETLSMAEGLLSEIGMNLKGEDQTPNTRNGESSEILGM